MDKNKLEKILLENIKIIYATFLKKGVFEEDAKDLTQDCFLAILKSSDKILNENAIFGYIYSTVNNRYKKYLTTKKMNSYIPLDDNYPSNNEVGYESENYNKLRRELALLSKEYRECTVLYYFNDYTINGIANKLNLSSEMVKYYLFKTRKILKEGINMERIFGKKSYEPEELGFTCIFNGNCDSNFENLFNRKIVGNIILSAYYTPMSLLELSVELGVASVYLEDEIDLLLKYKVLKKVGKKYQANVVVLTKEYFQSFIKKSSIIIKESLAKVFDLVQNNIFDLKKNNLITGNNLENYIKWSLLPLLLSLGFEKTKNDLQIKNYFEGDNKIYYFKNYREAFKEYMTRMCIGYTPITNNYGCSIIDFCCISEPVLFGKVVEKVNNNATEFVIINKKLEKDLEFHLNDAIHIVNEMYKKVYAISMDLLTEHSPQFLNQQIPIIVEQSLYYETLGIIGKIIVDNKILDLPNNGEIVSIILYK